MLWHVGLIKKGSEPEKNLDRVFESLEIAKVLSMDIPVALVIELPKRGVTSNRPHPDFSDLLLCFPCSSCVHVYLYSLRDGKFQFKDLGKYSDGEEYCGKDEEVRQYKYAVRLTPFTYRMPEQALATIQFRFQIQQVGHNVVEITVGLSDTEREKEWIAVNYYDCSSDYWYNRGAGMQHIVTLERKQTTKGFVWKPTEEKPDIKELPFIQGYMTKD